MRVEVTLEFASTPPSLNRTGASGGWRVFARHKKRWQQDIESLLMVAGVPRDCRRVVACAELRFPTRRSRDSGNHRVVIEKACGDALVNAGRIADDTPDFYEFGLVTFDPAPGPARTLLRLTYE